MLLGVNSFIAIGREAPIDKRSGDTACFESVGDDLASLECHEGARPSPRLQVDRTKRNGSGSTKRARR